jgi:hypothetical protein
MAFQGKHCFDYLTIDDIFEMKKDGLPGCFHRIPAGTLYLVFAGSIHLFFNVSRDSLSYALDTFFYRLYPDLLRLVNTHCERMSRLPPEEGVLSEARKQEWCAFSGLPASGLRAPNESEITSLEAEVACRACGQLMLDYGDKNLRDVLQGCDASVPVLYVNLSGHPCLERLTRELPGVVGEDPPDKPSWRFFPTLAKTPQKILNILSLLGTLPIFSEAYPPRLRHFLKLSCHGLPWCYIEAQVLLAIKNLQTSLTHAGENKKKKELQFNLDFNQSTLSELRGKSDFLNECWMLPGQVPGIRRDFKRHKMVLFLAEMCCNEVTQTLACLRNTVAAAHLDVWKFTWWEALADDSQTR